MINGIIKGKIQLDKIAGGAGMKRTDLHYIPFSRDEVGEKLDELSRYLQLSAEFGLEGQGQALIRRFEPQLEHKAWRRLRSHWYTPFRGACTVTCAAGRNIWASIRRAPASKSWRRILRTRDRAAGRGQDILPACEAAKQMWGSIRGGHIRRV